MKICLVTKGDARKRRTWSGVPFLVRERLLRDGHSVVDFNVFSDFWFHWIGAAWNRFHDVKRLEFEATRLGGWLMARAVRKAASGCDRVVALTFALDPRRVGAPVELVCDWTLGYFWKRRDRAEERVLGRMRRAAAVKCFYPAAADYLRANGVDVEYVGLPVDEPPDDVGRVEDGLRHAVVFAAPHHIDNLTPCAEMERFDVVDVIGCRRRDEGRFRFHGYLDKDDPTQRRRYWEILKSADAVIAMGRSWPGGSSLAEAKACGCEVVTRPWPDLRDIVGAKAETV